MLSEASGSLEKLIAPVAEVPKSRKAIINAHYWARRRLQGFKVFHHSRRDYAVPVTIVQDIKEVLLR